MTITDKIYGTFSITTPVLLELLSSPALLRLQDISQMGPPNKYYHIHNYSRYEHSIGVMLLLKHLSASLEEQIAGLLHDVSHTAFSHVIDWVVGSGKSENFQDNQHESFIQKTEIPNILKKHGYSVDTIVHYKHFPLLEQDIPALCADRIDYVFREIPASVARMCFTQLAIHKNRIAFRSEKTAYTFAHEFLMRQRDHWGGYEAVTRYTLFSAALKRALTLQLVTMADFQGTETPILHALENSTDSEIIVLLTTLRKKDLSFLAKNAVVSHKKFRYVDPDVIMDQQLVALSQINSDFKKEIEIARVENAKGMKSGTI